MEVVLVTVLYCITVFQSVTDLNFVRIVVISLNVRMCALLFRLPVMSKKKDLVCHSV